MVITAKNQLLSSGQVDEKKRELIKQINLDFCQQFTDIKTEIKIWFSNQMEDQSIQQLQHIVDREKSKKISVLNNYYELYLKYQANQEQFKNSGYLQEPAPEENDPSLGTVLVDETEEINNDEFAPMLESVSKVTIHKPIGLKNIKSCCYFNSLLQTFFHIPQLTQGIQSLDLYNKNFNEILVRQSGEHSLRLTQELQKLFRNMVKQTIRPKLQYLDPSSLLNHVTEMNGKKIEFGEHRDVTEFMMIIIKQIQKFVKVYLKTLSDQRKKPESFNINLDIFKAQFHEYDCYLKQAPRHTGLNNTRKNNMKMITINNIPNKSFSDLIEMALITEGMTKHGNVIKKQWLETLPDILTVQISRFEYSNGKSVKKNEYVPIETEIDMSTALLSNCVQSSKYKQMTETLKTKKEKLNQVLASRDVMEDLYANEKCYEHSNLIMKKLNMLSKKQKQEYDNEDNDIKRLKDQLKNKGTRYSLFSVIIHQGTLTSGHYYAYIKKGKNWYLCNDSQINSSVDEEHVQNHARGDGSSSANAYICIYMKKSFQQIEELDQEMRNYAYTKMFKIDDSSQDPYNDDTMSCVKTEMSFDIDDGKDFDIIDHKFTDGNLNNGGFDFTEFRASNMKKKDDDVHIKVNKDNLFSKTNHVKYDSKVTNKMIMHAENNQQQNPQKMASEEKVEPKNQDFRKKASTITEARDQKLNKPKNEIQNPTRNSKMNKNTGTETPESVNQNLLKNNTFTQKNDSISSYNKNAFKKNPSEEKKAVILNNQKSNLTTKTDLNNIKPQILHTDKEKIKQQVEEQKNKLAEKKASNFPAKEKSNFKLHQINSGDYTKSKFHSSFSKLGSVDNSDKDSSDSESETSINALVEDTAAVENQNSKHKSSFHRIDSPPEKTTQESVLSIKPKFQSNISDLSVYSPQKRIDITGSKFNKIESKFDKADQKIGNPKSENPKADSNFLNSTQRTIKKSPKLKNSEVKQVINKPDQYDGQMSNQKSKITTECEGTFTGGMDKVSYIDEEYNDKLASQFSTGTALPEINHRIYKDIDNKSTLTKNNTEYEENDRFSALQQATLAMLEENELKVILLDKKSNSKVEKNEFDSELKNLKQYSRLKDDPNFLDQRAVNNYEISILDDVNASKITSFNIAVSEEKVKPVEKEHAKLIKNNILKDDSLPLKMDKKPTQFDLLSQELKNQQENAKKNQSDISQSEILRPKDDVFGEDNPGHRSNFNKNKPAHQTDSIITKEDLIRENDDYPDQKNFKKMKTQEKEEEMSSDNLVLKNKSVFVQKFDSSRKLWLVEQTVYKRQKIDKTKFWRFNNFAIYVLYKYENDRNHYYNQILQISINKRIWFELAVHKIFPGKKEEWQTFDFIFYEERDKIKKNICEPMCDQAEMDKTLDKFKLEYSDVIFSIWLLLRAMRHSFKEGSQLSNCFRIMLYYYLVNKSIPYFLDDIAYNLINHFSRKMNRIFDLEQIKQKFVYKESTIIYAIHFIKLSQTRSKKTPFYQKEIKQHRAEVTRCIRDGQEMVSKCNFNSDLLLENMQCWEAIVLTLNQLLNDVTFEIYREQLFSENIFDQYNKEIPDLLDYDAINTKHLLDEFLSSYRYFDNKK